MKLLTSRKLTIIYGPTSTGKTALAIKLAKRFNGELISADSRQVYKSLDIGSGKAAFDSKIEKHDGFWIVDGVRINGFNLAQPEEQFTAAEFLKHTNSSIIQISEEKKVPIIVGGTGFYIKALIEGLDSTGIPANKNLRRQLENAGINELYQKLLNLNPRRAKSMNESDRKNPRRLIRAVEIATSKKPIPINYPLRPAVRRTRTAGHCLPTTHYQLIGLTASNDYLYLRSDIWLNERIKHGLIEEVKSLIKSGVSIEWLENLGLEYRWLTRYLLGQISKEEAINRLKGDTHNFIRRQKTWFKQFANIEIYDIEQKNYTRKIEEIFANFNRADIY